MSRRTRFGLRLVPSERAVRASDPQLFDLHQHLLHDGVRLYVGTSESGLCFADPEQALLVLGPPRSGKTSSLVIPNVLASPGPVVSTSTKPDVMRVTAASRAEVGRCWLLDPSGTVPAPRGVTRVRWSPVCSSAQWDEAQVTAHAMVYAARPGTDREEASHWSERAEALLAPLFHAAALSSGDMRVVLRWVLRHDLENARAILGGHGAEIAGDVLGGVAATDSREQSGIWSTAAEALAAYRSQAALDGASDPNFNPRALIESTDTVYVCAPARQQTLFASIVVAFIEDVRAAAYEAARERCTYPPLTLALDEVANIAPLPSLPAMVSDGGSQGLSILACLQDLSQARQRWGGAADGLLSLFGAKVVLPGIGDLSTLELVSRLAGDVLVPVRSTSQSKWWSASRGAETVTWTMQRQRRLPVDAVHQQPPGTALILAGAEAPAAIRLPPWWLTEPFVSARTRTLPASSPAPARHPSDQSIDRV